MFPVLQMTKLVGPKEENFSSHIFYELLPVSYPYSHVTPQNNISSEFGSLKLPLGLWVVNQMAWVEASKAQPRANVKNKISQKYGRIDMC